MTMFLNPGPHIYCRVPRCPTAWSNISDYRQLFINNGLTTSYPRGQAQNMSLFTISVNDAAWGSGGWEGGRRLLPIVMVQIDWQGVAKGDKPVD